MDEDKQVLAKHCAHGWVWLFGDEIEERLHGIKQCFTRQWRVLRVANENRPGAIPSQLVAVQNAGGHRRAEKLGVPLMRLTLLFKLRQLYFSSYKRT